MRRIGRLFGKNRNRKSGRTQNRQTQRLTQFTPHLEMLEERRLLAANILASGIGGAVDGTQMEFTVSGGSESSVLGLRVSSTDGLLNPAAPWIESVDGDIAPIYSTNNVSGSTDGLLLAELGPGTYTVTIKTEGGTFGQIQLDVFLPGDMDGDGTISEQEYLQARAASVQNDGYWNSFTARYYRSLGINLNEDQYDPGLDVNSDGHIDGFDLGHMYPNVGAAKITNVSIDPDITDPEIVAALETDSGRSSTDGVTNELAIVGSATDLNSLTSFTLSIDGAAAVDIRGDISDGSFSLNRARLEEINLGVSLEGGDDIHELRFVAEDDSDNTSTHVLSFTLDTETPDKPAAPDLLAESDSGSSDSDDITNVDTPTFLLDAEAGDFIKLSVVNHYNGQEFPADQGEGELFGSLLFTSDRLFDGKNIVTFTVEDVAGNISEKSEELEIIVDTTSPLINALDLADASDSGAKGDGITSETSVSLEGEARVTSLITESETTATLRLAGSTDPMATATVGADGKFTFDNVDLVWNANDFVAVAEDLAGNVTEADFPITVTQNNDPVVAGSIDTAFDNAIVDRQIPLVGSGLFDDDNFADGDKLTITIISNSNPDLLTETLVDGGNAVTKYSQDYILKLALTPDMEGEATITLLATDEVGGNAMAIVTITVVEGAQDDSALVDEGDTVDIAVTDNDIGNDPANATIISFDGTSALGATITETPGVDGSLSYDTGSIPDLDELAVGETLTDTFTYTIKDSIDEESTATVTVTVHGVNDEPVAEDDEAGDDEDKVMIIDVLGNDSDIDQSDILTVTEATSAEGATVTILGDGSLRYDPTGVAGLSDLKFGEVVTDTINYKISDGNGGEATAEVTITIDGVNETPQYDGSGLIQTEEDTPKTIDLHDYFSDEETPDADLTFELVSTPAGCTAVLQADGHSVLITPDADFNGLANFFVKVTDDTAASPGEIPEQIILVSVAAVNDAPVGVDDTADVDADGTVTIDVLDNDTDADTSDVLTIDGTDTPLGFEGAVSIEEGKIVFDPSGSQVIEQLEDGEELLQTFTYTVKDSADPSASDTADVTLTITGVNDAPTPIDVAPVSVAENNSVDIDLDSFFSDAETASAACTVTIDGATNGTYTYDPATHIVTFTPTADYNGPATVDFSVTDTANDPANVHTVQMTANITVTPVNDAPVLDDPTPATVDEDGSVSIDLRDRVSDTETGDDDLEFEINGDTKGTAVLDVDGYTVTFTPDANFNGAGSFTFNVTDTGDNAAVAETSTFTIDVDISPVNDPPRIDAPHVVTVEEDLPVDVDLWGLTFDQETADADLTFVITSVTNGTAVLDPVDGHTVTFTPDADYQGPAEFKYEVTDTGDGTAAAETSEITVEVLVTPVNDAPILNDPTPASTDEDTTVSIDLRNHVSDTETADDDLTFAIVGATDGTAVLDVDGYTVQFTPAANTNGTASFEFNVTDTGQGDAIPKTVLLSLDVDVAPVNDAPQTEESAPVAVNEDTTIVVDLRTRVSDLETADDDLVFTLEDPATPGGPATTVSNAMGTLTLLNNPSGNDYQVEFTPADDVAGLATFTFWTTDTGEGASLALKRSFVLFFSVAQVPDAPVAEDDTASGDADGTIEIDVLDNDTDADPGDVLSIVEPLATPPGFEGTISVAEGKIVFDPAASTAIAQLEDGEELVQTFSYTVKDSSDPANTDTADVTLTVTGVNDAPTPIVVAPVLVDEDGSVDIDLDSFFSDPETASADCIVTIDGATNGTYTYDPATHIVTFTPTADYNGPATVDFSVTDTANDAGNVHTVPMTANILVTPVNDAPIAENTDTLDVAEDGSVDIDLRTRVSDFETADDDLAFSVKNPVNGAVEMIDAYTARFTPDENHNGPASFEFEVTDTGDGDGTGDGAPATVGFSVDLNVTPVNDAPVLDPAAPAIDAVEDTLIDIDLREQFADIETQSGDLAFNLIGFTGGTAVLDIGDGHTVHFTPTADYAGGASITVDVTDTGDGTAAPVTEQFTVDFTVENTPDAPVANDDQVDATADAITTIDVLLNDTDADAGQTDTLTIVDSLAPQPGFLGTLAIVGNQIEFDPTGVDLISQLLDGQELQQTFTYEVRDSTGQVSTATATVTIDIIGVNDAPQPVLVATIFTPEETEVTFDLWNLFSDAEAPSGDFSGYTFTVTGAIGGTAVLNEAQHTVTFTPTENYNGAATVTFNVTDVANDAANKQTVSMTAFIIVTPVNDDPVAEDDGPITVQDDIDSTLDVLDNDSDVDAGDTLTIISVDDTGLDGQVSIDPGGLSLTYIPSGNYNGPETFSYTISDGNGGTDTADVVLDVVGNHAPTADDDAYNVTEDEVLNGNVLDNDDDPDTGDTIAVTAADVVWKSGDLIGLPPAVAADGSFSYDPRADYQFLAKDETREGVFEYTIEDNHGVAATAQVTITVTGVNDAPTSAPDTADTDADIATGGSLIALVNETDTNDSLAYGTLSATSTRGAAVSVHSTSGTWTFDPNGVAAFVALAGGETATDTFTYTVDDGNGGTTQNTITITVTGVNDDPTAAHGSGSVGADSTAVGTLAGLVNDPDDNDTLQYTLSGAAPLGDVQIDLNTGAWIYDPSGVAAFVALADGETAQDTFGYTVSDGHGGTAINTVTITVGGVNDTPTADDDSGATLNNSTVIIDLLDGDSDPDSSDNLSIASIDDSATGGSVADNGDGTVTYDPSAWAAAQSLAPGAEIQDTFEYTVSDGHGGTDTATVTVTVTGAVAAGDPQLINPIADRTITDDETQPIDYDLATVFSDDGPLTYEATSSNTDLVQVSIVGSTLSINYADYQSGMDRTPAVIDVTATEVGGSGASVSDQFVVTVVPETTVEVQFVVRESATPVGETSTDTLPDSLTNVGVGQNYVVEIWMKDLLDDTLTSGPVSTGLIGGMFDISFDKSIGQGISTHHEGAFTFEPSGDILNDQGLIDNFHGGTLDSDNGIDGNYVRLGYVTFQATAAGDQVFSLSYEDLSRLSAGSSNVTGTVDEAQVSLPSVTVSQQNTVIFTLDNSASVDVDGVAFGQSLDAQVPSSDHAELSGTVEAIVTYDSFGEPQSIKFIDANIVVGNFEELLAPGIGGVAGTDWANVGLKNTAAGLNIAFRDMVLGLTTDQPILLNGAQLDQSTIDFTASQGSIDANAGLLVKTISLAGESVVDDGSPMGSLIKNVAAGQLELVLPFIRTVDISDETLTPGDYITFNGHINANLALAALTATETAQTAAAADETNLVMTLNKHATALGPDGQVDTLPISEAWLDEWDSYWVEIWARTGEGSGINAAALDLAYNGDYFTAVEIQHGRAFTENTSGDISVDGIVAALGGSANRTGLGSDGFVMVGRVKFESLGDDQVPIDSFSRVIGPHELGLEISAAQIEVEGVEETHVVLGAAPRTELWAVPYDVDDNDRIDLGDLAFFAQSYQTDVLDSTASFVWASDYDKSGDIDLGDLSFFASNYRKAKGGDSDVAYPATFLQRWIGSGIEAEGGSAVHEVLAAAVKTWQDKLGLDEPIDIQLVVKDFGDSQLGEGRILEVDEAGRPTSGRITLDDDAAGIGWHSQLDGAVAEGKYDLYTVILHEVGHTLGFMQEYDGFADNVEPHAEGGQVFVAADFTAPLDTAGQHLDDAANPGDLMNSTLTPGIRRLPSDMTAAMLNTAYESATLGGGGFAAIGAAMHAEGDVFANTASTADFSQVEDRLEGDVTWNRIFGGHDDRLKASDTQSVDQTVLDTVIDDISRADFNCDIPEVAEHVRLDAAAFAMHNHDDMAIDRPADKKADGKNIFDAVFGDWDQPLG